MDATSAGQDAHSSSRKRHVSLAPRPPAEYAPDTSAYVIAALNRFGEAGGMAPLAQRLSSGRAPFNEVLETFRLAKALRTHASSRSMKEVNWTLKECAAGALLSVAPESMRATTKVDIAECVSSVKDLALTGSGTKGAANPPLVLVQELEQLELGMAMKVCANVFCLFFGLRERPVNQVYHQDAGGALSEMFASGGDEGVAVVVPCRADCFF